MLTCTFMQNEVPESRYLGRREEKSQTRSSHDATKIEHVSQTHHYIFK